MKCFLCTEEIQPGTPAISIIGGLFPASDPDFFVVDEQVMGERHAHLGCLTATVTTEKKTPP